jgi:hypothetical protein
MSLETCWAVKEQLNNKTFSTELYLVGHFYKILYYDARIYEWQISNKFPTLVSISNENIRDAQISEVVD